ncbi:MAG: pantoate--beta-alanine ligase, partial [Saprospiraceae bacterium]|nr:pantoate--beta-alanine ligase [Saprospiraceae bacterium]
KRLLDIVQPDLLFMGQKDYQQFAIVQHMIAVLEMPVRLKMSATVRETDGLAMSSRNMRLTSEQRAIAPTIFQTLTAAKAQLLDNENPQLVAAAAMEALNTPGISPEYFEIVDGKTLQPINSLEGHDLVVACTAAKLGEVRLIDNLVVKEI